MGRRNKRESPGRPEGRGVCGNLRNQVVMCVGGGVLNKKTGKEEHFWGSGRNLMYGNSDKSSRVIPAKNLSNSGYVTGSCRLLGSDW